MLLKVYHASQLHLPLCSTKEQDHAQIAARRKEKLFIDGIALPFPETMEKLENWLNGKLLFSRHDDEWHGGVHVKTMTGNPRRREKNLYEGGHVTEAEYNNTLDCLKFCYVRGKVVPQTRIGETKRTRCFASVVFAPWASHNIL